MSTVEFIWVCAYCLLYVLAEKTDNLFCLSATMAIYTGLLVLWLFWSGRADKIRFCRIRVNAEAAAAVMPALLLFPAYNCLTAAYLERKIWTALLTLSCCVAEEVFFRGFLLQYLKKYGIKTSVVVSSLIFALYHLGNDAQSPGALFVCLQVIASFSAGMCYGAALCLSDSILPCILAHFLTNVTASPVPDVHLAPLCVCIGLSCVFGIYILHKCDIKQRRKI